MCFYSSVNMSLFRSCIRGVLRKLWKRIARSHLSPCSCSSSSSSMRSIEWIKIKTNVENVIKIEIAHEDHKGQAPYQISEPYNFKSQFIWYTLKNHTKFWYWWLGYICVCVCVKLVGLCLCGYTTVFQTSPFVDLCLWWVTYFEGKVWEKIHSLRRQKKQTVWEMSPYGA